VLYYCYSRTLAQISQRVIPSREKHLSAHNHPSSLLGRTTLAGRCPNGNLLEAFFCFFGSKRIAGASKLEYMQPRPGKMQLRRPYCHGTEGLPTVSKAVLPSKTY
jgi:hypothetical protein